MEPICQPPADERKKPVPGFHATRTSAYASGGVRAIFDMKKHKPSTNGVNGRDESGRFTPGNTGGPGNPFAKRVARLRAELLRSVTLKDVREIVRTLVLQAKLGDLPAIKELLDRLLGKPVESDLFEKLDELERVLDALTKQDR